MELDRKHDYVILQNDCALPLTSEVAETIALFMAVHGVARTALGGRLDARRTSQAGFGP